jgi:DNA-binding transcriptional LysR family regulator
MTLLVDSLLSLQAFVHAAELRSFRLAGQQMGLSSSGIGKSIQRLEEQLGTRLFHRTTRSITLTEEGRMFLERSRRVLAEMEGARADLARSAEAPRGRLKVSMPVANSLFTPIMSAFMREYPEVTLELDFNDRFVDVIEEGFDVVLRSGELSDSRLQHRRLGHFEWRLVAAPSYLNRAGTPASAADLAGHICLRHRFTQTGKLEPWPLAARYAEIDVPVSLATTMVDSLLILADEGAGIAALPHFLVDRRLADGRLVEILGGCLDGRVSFSLLWPGSRYPLPKVRAFVDFLAARLAPSLT